MKKKLQDKKNLILNFINGPLQKYLTEDCSYAKFIEEINEIFGTDFRYSDLYPSYLFNVELARLILHYTELDHTEQLDTK